MAQVDTVDALDREHAAKLQSLQAVFAEKESAMRGEYDLRLGDMQRDAQQR